MFEPVISYSMAKYIMKILEDMRRASRWDKAQRAFIWTQEAFEADIDKNMEHITMQQISAMSVLGCLNFNWDSPSLHKELQMPVLDTVVWIGIPQRKWGVLPEILPKETKLPEKTKVLKPIVFYKFNRKTMANRTTLHHRSAVPEKDRVQTVSNEFLWR